MVNIADIVSETNNDKQSNDSLGYSNNLKEQ